LSEQLHIPALFKTIVERVSDRMTFPVYFDYGSYDAVSKNLKSLDESVTMKDRKYPLVWLNTPIREVKPVGGEFASQLPDGVDILILMGTDSDSSNDERNTDSFTAYLRPIYKELLNQIDGSYYFDCLSVNSIRHEVKEWPYHSGVESVSGKANLFNDFIDCIQIRRMVLNVNHSQTFVNV
jgi:hypothetical protein